VIGVGEPGKYEGMNENCTTETKTPRMVKSRDDCCNFMLFAANELEESQRRKGRKERKAMKDAKQLKDAKDAKQVKSAKSAM
jgi:hypothetical protein